MPATTTCWSSTTCCAASCTGGRTGEEGREGGRAETEGFRQLGLLCGPCSDKLTGAMGWLRRRRDSSTNCCVRAWKGLTHRARIDAGAILCVIIFLAPPPMEIIPFTANAVGIALLVLGLGLIANDGLLASLAFVISAGSIGLVLYYLVF